MQDRETDGLKDLVWSTKVIQQHDKEAMVSKLMKFSMPVLVILNKHVGDCHQNLQPLQH